MTADSPSTSEEIIAASSSIIGNVKHTHKQPPHDSHHNHDNHDQQQHGAHGHYQFSPYFERAVELINTAAGIIVMASVLLAGINIILVALNANFSKSTSVFKCLLHSFNICMFLSLVVWHRCWRESQTLYIFYLTSNFSSDILFSYILLFFVWITHLRSD